ncbi:MAG: HAMP domain-containing sensor histidine kinase [Tissierellia bacterium]|nr:HAMP domain-containing sensor histidine kinase [Tissierellia bacterium]
MNEKKKIGLQALFLKYLVGYCLYIALILALSITAFMTAIHEGIILPANHIEGLLHERAEQLKAIPFQKELLPAKTSYLLIGKKGESLDTNLNREKAEQLLEMIQTDPAYRGDNPLILSRKDGSRLIIQYPIAAYFADPTLDRIFPHLELMQLLLFIFIFISLALIFAYGFSKRLKKDLTPLLAATQAIQEENLDFSFPPASIREIGDISRALDQLKESLSSSLRSQWNLERRKRAQYRALAHDIKTPLTIIRGNAELLEEGALSNGEKTHLAYIIESTEVIEKYLHVLLDISPSKDENAVKKETFPLAPFLEEVESLGQMLTQVRGQELIVKSKNFPTAFFGDRSLLFRALSNLLDNACEHSPSGSQIQLKIQQSLDGGLTFTLEDQGPGFSSEALKYATDQFYTGELYRSGKHYGYGLYLVKQIAEIHFGKIILSNRAEGPGALVTLQVLGNLTDESIRDRSI